MSRSILLLGAEDSWAEHIVPAAVALDVDVHLAIQQDAYGRLPERVSRHLADTVLTDFRSPPRAAEELAAYCTRVGVSGVAVGWKFLSPLAAALADRLGLPGHEPGPAEAGRNRRLMAQVLRQHGVPTPLTLPVTTAEATSERIRVAGLEYPVIVKPAESTAAGPILVASPAELAGAIGSGRPRGGVPPHGADGDPTLLVQEYVDGPEFSVATLMHRGVCAHVAVIRTFTTGGRTRREIGHSLPADIDFAAGAGLLAAVERGLASLGLRDGIVHTGAKLTSAGARLLTVEPVPPGGPVLQLIEQATGVSAARAYLQVVLGEWPDIRPRRATAAALRLISTEQRGIFRGFDGLMASPHPAVIRSYLEPGDFVGGAGTTHTHLGHVIVLALRPAQADAWADEAVAGITSRIEAFRPGP